jgi:hypothetical protein
MGEPLFTYYADRQSPAAVATVFAASHFDPPREVLDCTGAWVGATEWMGRFRLVDGVRDYRLFGSGGRWTVSVQEIEPPADRGGGDA